MSAELCLYNSCWWADSWWPGDARRQVIGGRGIRYIGQAGPRILYSDVYNICIYNIYPAQCLYTVLFCIVMVISCSILNWIHGIRLFRSFRIASLALRWRWDNYIAYCDINRWRDYWDLLCLLWYRAEAAVTSSGSLLSTHPLLPHRWKY